MPGLISVFADVIERRSQCATEVINVIEIYWRKRLFVNGTKTGSICENSTFQETKVPQIQINPLDRVWNHLSGLIRITTLCKTDFYRFLHSTLSFKNLSES